jgi:hypothetical protein
MMTAFCEKNDSETLYPDFITMTKMPLYGFSPASPISVGGMPERSVERSYYYLSELAGPRGEEVYFRRQVYVHQYLCVSGLINLPRPLDLYHVWLKHTQQKYRLYLDLYHFEPPHIPLGFTQKHNRRDPFFIFGTT